MTHCGFVAIVGRPNVGKSTLLNYSLGTKISITSSKPQTTRYRLLGVKTLPDNQIVYVDTPGLHQSAKGALNRYMNRTALRSLHDVDVVVFVVDCQYFDSDDAWVLEQLARVKSPVILAINKIDKLKDRAQLLPLIEDYAKKYPFKSIIPISALEGDQIDKLEQELIKYLPESPFFFPEDQICDRGDQFIASEIIREKLMRFLKKELPYGLTVTLDAFVEEPDIVRISAVIWVEKDSHKPIVIGKQGAQLKKIGQAARQDLEEYFSKQVYVQLWVKIKSGWSDDERLLKQFGYDES